VLRILVSCYGRTCIFSSQLKYAWISVFGFVCGYAYANLFATLQSRGLDSHDQAAMLHAFKAYEPASELGDDGGLAMHDEDF